MSKRAAWSNDLMQILSTWSGTAMIIVLVLVGMIFWHPGYRAWGLVSLGLLIAMLIWMLRGLHERVNSVPGNPIHWIWLAMTVYLSIFQFFSQYYPAIVPSSGLNGFINISVILQILLLSLGCMLFQEFMSKGQAARWLREITAICIILLSLAINELYPLEIPRTSVWLAGCAGVMMAAANAFWAGSSRLVGFSGINRRHLVAIWGQLIIAGLGLLILIYSGTVKSFGLFLCIIVTVCGFSFAARKWAARGLLFYVSAGFIWWVIIMSGCLYFYNGDQPITFLGYGEGGVRYFDGMDDGITVLFNLIGALGVGGVFAGLIAVSLTVISKADKSSPNNFWKTVLWLAACWLATAAWTGKKAFFSVMPLMIMMMTWGLLLTIAEIKTKRLRAWRLAVPMGIGIFWLAVANIEMLFQKSALSTGYNDFSLHKIAGAVFCVFMVWWWGRAKWWLAIPAVIFAALAGGAGEIVQKYFSSRSEDFRDWEAHLKGVGILAVMLVFIFAGRAGLTCSGGRIISAKPGWKKYVRISGMMGQTIAIVLLMCFWFDFTTESLPGNAYRHIEIISKDNVMVTNYPKLKRYPYYFSAICNYKLYSGSAEFYGLYMDAPQRKMFTCYTAAPTRNVFSFLDFGIGTPPEGVHWISLRGDPFGPGGYLRRDVILKSFSPDARLLLVDTESAIKWSVENDGFAQKLNSLQNVNGYQLILVHPGSWKKYLKDLPLLRELFPNVPIMGGRFEEWSLREVAQIIRMNLFLHQNHQKTICLTDNLYYMSSFASGLGNYNCVRSILIEPAPKISEKFTTGSQRHLFIKRKNILDVLDEIAAGKLDKR